MTDPLQALLAEAIKEAKKPAPEVHTKRVSAKFSRDENWETTKTVALVHKPSMTLLGNFQEYLHKNLDARKLVRVKLPAAASCIEYVTGDFYLSTKRENAHSRTADHTKVVTCGITLSEMQLHCPNARVRVYFLYEEEQLIGISKIELLEKTRFNCEMRNTFLFLDSGLDVIEAMDRDSKIALKAELGI